jgi:hypothetical protein
MSNPLICGPGSFYPRFCSVNNSKLTRRANHLQIDGVKNTRKPASKLRSRAFSLAQKNTQKTFVPPHFLIPLDCGYWGQGIRHADGSGGVAGCGLPRLVRGAGAGARGRCRDRRGVGCSGARTCRRGGGRHRWLHRRACDLALLEHARVIASRTRAADIASSRRARATDYGQCAYSAVETLPAATQSAAGGRSDGEHRDAAGSGARVGRAQNSGDLFFSLLRRANHLHSVIIARIEPAVRKTGPAGFFVWIFSQRWPQPARIICATLRASLPSVLLICACNAVRTGRSLDTYHRASLPPPRAKKPLR